MKYEMSLLERLTLLQALPASGNFATIKIVRRLREDLSLSEEEWIAYKVVQRDDGSVTWSREDAKSKVVEIGPTGLSIIQKALKKLNDEEALREEHIPVYAKFVGDDA